MGASVARPTLNLVHVLVRGATNGRGLQSSSGGRGIPHLSALRVFGEQQWEELTSGEFPLENHPKLCRCWRCKRISLWFGGMMIIPATSGAPPPSPNLPQSVRADYDEARAVTG